VQFPSHKVIQVQTMSTWTQLAVEHVSAISKEEFSTTHRGKLTVMIVRINAIKKAI